LAGLADVVEVVEAVEAVDVLSGFDSCNFGPFFAMTSVYT
jgi:hypothetical protein